MKLFQLICIKTASSAALRALEKNLLVKKLYNFSWLNDQFLIYKFF
jgi:hypothetical protein